MICIIAGNYEEAYRWARSQMLAVNEWFYPNTVADIKSRENFHVIVVGTAGFSIPSDYFNQIYTLAQQRGRQNRK
jgi:hypothetical protein